MERVEAMKRVLEIEEKITNSGYCRTCGILALGAKQKIACRILLQALEGAKKKSSNVDFSLKGFFGVGEVMMIQSSDFVGFTSLIF